MIQRLLLKFGLVKETPKKIIIKKKEEQNEVEKKKVSWNPI